MTDLGPILTRLGVDQYHDALVGEGFDTWETVLDIQEHDFDVLNVKLGHRRKLQREIANYRGISYENSLGSLGHEGALEASKTNDSISIPPRPAERSSQGGNENKRKYRRHPKLDENAPERPPSAYVIFSNKVREDVRGQNLSFTDIAKLVGDKWQKLNPAGKEPFETQANRAKERYSVELATYKKTDKYKEYLQYLADFKAKHGANTAEGKRPRVEQEPSGPGISTRATDASEGHGRMGSVSSMGSTSYKGALPSPSGATVALAAALSTQAISPSSARLPPISPNSDSPPLSLLLREPRFHPPSLSTHSSVSDDSSVYRGEQSDPIPRANQLSLAPSSTLTTPTLPSPTAGLSPGFIDPSRRQSRPPTSLQQNDSSGSSLSHASLSSSYADSSSSSLLLPVTPIDEPWRSQLPEASPLSYPEYVRPSRPPVTSHHGLPYGTLPPMIAPEMLSDVPRDLSLRTLPPPRPSSPQGHQHGLRSRSQTTPQAHHCDVFLPTLSEPEQRRGSLEMSESDAVNTLAVLAYGGGVVEPRRGIDRKRPRHG